MVVRKTLLTLGIVLLSYLIIISGYSAVKKPMFDQVSMALTEIGKEIDSESWENANAKLKKVQQTWTEEKSKYQLNHTTNQIDNFEKSLTRLLAFIQSKEKAQGIAELAETKLFWQKLNRL